MIRRILAVFAALALIVGLAPAAHAQNTGSVRIGDFTFNAAINTGQSQLRPGGYVRIDLTATNTNGTKKLGLPYSDNRVLNTYGFTVPAGYTLRGSGGTDMRDPGTHDQANYFGGKPRNVAHQTVQKDSSRSGWLSFNIPANAEGGSRHDFGIRAHLETGGSWFPTAENVVGFTLGAVATTTTVTAEPATVSPPRSARRTAPTRSTRATSSSSWTASRSDGCPSAPTGGPPPRTWSRCWTTATR